MADVLLFHYYLISSSLLGSHSYALWAAPTSRHPQESLVWIPPSLLLSPAGRSACPISRYACAPPPLVLGSSFLSLLFISNDKIIRGSWEDFSAEMNQFGDYNFKNGIISPLADPGRGSQ